VRLAHQLAVENELVKADMIEVIEFPHLAVKYQVQGVPLTVINETAHIEGAVAEPVLMAKLKAVVR
jgi:predicted DsbA family dithiol-disulfide isomerase